MSWRLALDHQRAARRRAAREHHAAPSGITAAPGAAADDAQRLWAAIDQLPERLRWPLVLAAIEGHDVREVAALVGAPGVAHRCCASSRRDSD
ncbi:MAG: sigma factor-like helix-turn-helix DNA-binding protein [Vicinamibacterales bacterium]